MPAMPQVTITVSNISYDRAVPDVSLDFEPTEWLIVNRSSSPSDIVEFSFDGVDSHGSVIPGSPIAAVSYRIRAKKLWLIDVGGGNPTVTIMANSEK